MESITNWASQNVSDSNEISGEKNEATSKPSLSFL